MRYHSKQVNIPLGPRRIHINHTFQMPSMSLAIHVDFPAIHELQKVDEKCLNNVDFALG